MDKQRKNRYGNTQNSDISPENTNNKVLANFPRRITFAAVFGGFEPVTLNLIQGEDLKIALTIKHNYI
jgi:hypothetical protein